MFEITNGVFNFEQLGPEVSCFEQIELIKTFL